MLRYDRDTPGITCFSYLDLGDSGVRVIFDEPNQLPEPLDNADLKGIDTTAVEGPGVGVNRWYEIQTMGSLPLSTPFYLPSIEKSLNFGLEPTLDNLYNFPFWHAVSPLASVNLGNGSDENDENDENTDSPYYDPERPYKDLQLLDPLPDWEENKSLFCAKKIHLDWAQNFLHKIAIEAKESDLDADDIQGVSVCPRSPYFGSVAKLYASVFDEPVVYDWDMYVRLENVTFGFGDRTEKPFLNYAFTTYMGYTVDGDYENYQFPRETKEFNIHLVVKKLLPDGQPGEIIADYHHTFNVQPQLWDQSWEIHQGINDQFTEFASLNALDIDLVKYRIEFRHVDGKRDSITLRKLDDLKGVYSFLGSGEDSQQQQGNILYNFLVDIASEDIEARGVINTLVNINSFALKMMYGRSYFPAILTSEKRSYDPFNNKYLLFQPLETTSTDPNAYPSVLTCKPASDSTLSNLDPKISLSMKLGGVTLVALAIELIAFFTAIGVTWIIGTLSALLAAIASPVGIFGAFFALVALAFLVSVTVPRLIENYIENKIIDEAETIKESLDNEQILRFAGEGLAEDIAKRFIELSSTGEPNLNEGLNRFKRNFFQMIFVSRGSCKVLIRDEN